MGLIIPISHGNLRITDYPGKYRGNFTEKSPENFEMLSKHNAVPPAGRK